MEIPKETVSSKTSQFAAARELFDAESSSRTRTIGFIAVIALLVSSTLTFLVFIERTGIEPNRETVITAAIINGTLILVLVFLIGKEISHIVRSRRKGRAASRLHVRIIGLFAFVAVFPAALVALVAAFTLNAGLDRWFEVRTKRIVESSISIARAYQNESTRVLLGNTLSMAANLDRNRQLYVLDRNTFEELFVAEATGRGLIYASLSDETGEERVIFNLNQRKDFPPVPKLAIERAKEGKAVPVPPVDTNLVGVVVKLRNISNAYLYTVIAVPPAVLEAIAETNRNSTEYSELERNRIPFQIAFALLYLGVCVVVLLAAMWMGISVARRIVTPIRKLMSAANEVSRGNMNARVNVAGSEGDLRFLSETFNVMLGEIDSKQSDLLSANRLMDERATFIEAVLSGVSASVIGMDGEGTVAIANRSAGELLGIASDPGEETLRLHEVDPELGRIFDEAITKGSDEYRNQIVLEIDGQERTLNVQIIRERDRESEHSYVMTLDDITDLVSAQRNSAWADIARRIAHEIKNPLTPIQLSAERIRRRYGKLITEDREVFDNCTDTIIRQVGDIGRMVDEFSSFARMPEPVMEVLDIRSTIKETVFLQKVGFPKIEFDMILPDESVPVLYDARMMSQALINVIKNAAEAIEGLEEAGGKAGKIDIIVKQTGRQAIIDVVDNGKGLPKSDRQKLMEPYMTTREKGTGLGLSIVRKIIEDHGGKLQLMDAPGVKDGGTGALMRFTLPIAETKASAKKKQADQRKVQ